LDDVNLFLTKPATWLSLKFFYDLKVLFYRPNFSILSIPFFFYKTHNFSLFFNKNDDFT
jgi:hypothetical protein